MKMQIGKYNSENIIREIQNAEYNSENTSRKTKVGKTEFGTQKTTHNRFGEIQYKSENAILKSTNQKTEFGTHKREIQIKVNK